MKMKKGIKNRIKGIGLLLMLGCIFSCDRYENDAASLENGGGSGTGGSMARFTIEGDYMYTVDNTTLKVFDISIPDDPRHMYSKDQNLMAGAETIFTMDTLLFIGSQNGMYIFNISNPEFPQEMSFVSHIKSCDPVIAKGNYAYVTLNSNSRWCGRSSNVLQIYDISDPYAPVMLKEMGSPLKNPLGLGIDGDKLFICDNGLKVFDVSVPDQPQWMDDLDKIREIESIETYDVIPLDGILLVIGADGLYQFDYSGERLAFISKIVVNREEK